MRIRLLCITVLLAACGTDALPIPESPQTLSGSLLPADISFARRGTHILTLADQSEVYVESPIVNLRRYAGRSLTVRGAYETNLDPSLPPVLVVQEVLQAEDVSRVWSSDALRISLRIPSAWGVMEAGQRVEFLPSGSLTAVVGISASADPLPVGTPIVIDQRKAVRAIDPNTGRQTVIIERGSDRVVLTFTPEAYTGDQEALRTEWLSLLQTINLSNIATSVSSVAPTGTGSVSGAPCGGSAGVLCPAGHYCEINDTTNNIGVCKKL